MTKVLTFASTKGGTGKSTLCVNLAAFFAQCGKRVTVLDVDPQKSSYDWIQESSDELLSLISAIHLTEERQIETVIAETDSDIVCIDLQGSLNNSPLFAFAIADIILVPCRPSRDDIIGLGWILKLHEMASEKFPTSDAKVIAILNAVNARSVIYAHAKEQIEADNITLISNPVTQTVAFAEANINRVSVFGSNGKAKNIMQNVGSELSEHLFQ